MPFLRDEGPPVSQATIQRARESFPLDYGFQVVNEKGRDVLIVRVPKAKPDYLHDLADVAFYVSLDTIRSCKDILLVGHEKTARLEPQLLRDNIRAQDREDADMVPDIRRKVGREYGQMILQSPLNHVHQALAVRIPKASVTEFSPDDVKAIRDVVQRQNSRFDACQYAYIVADRDHERLGRRVLLELLGASSAPTPAETPLAPAVTTAPPPAITPAYAPAPTAAPVAAPPVAAAPLAFPRTPGTAPASAAPIATTAPAVATSAIPGFLHNAVSIATAPPASTPPTPALASQTIEETPQATTQAQAPPTPQPLEVAETDEYAIISKPKAPAAAAESAAAHPHVRAHAAAPPGTDVQVHEEYEIVSKPKPAETPAIPATASPAHEPEPERKVAHATEEFEVYTSKPKPRAADSAPAITPPGMGGFQAALSSATSAVSPRRSKEYEISSRPSAPAEGNIAKLLAQAQHAAPPPPAAPAAAQAPAPAYAPASTYATPAPAFASAPAATTLPPIFHQPAAPPQPVSPSSASNVATGAMSWRAPPVDDPRVQAALPARAPAAATMVAPTQDNGATVMPILAPAQPEVLLAQRFRENGYEIVEGLRAQGTIFAFAAHKPNGRRVLVKRATDFAPDDAAALAGLLSALGADVGIVVADRIAPGTRLATWGTRIEVCTPTDAAGWTF